MTYNLSPKPSSPTWEGDFRGKTKPELRRYVRLLKQQFTAEELTEQSHHFLIYLNARRSQHTRAYSATLR